jgi:hypothetical protein
VGGIGRDITQEDIVFKAILQDFKRLMRSKTIINQNTWLLIRPRFGLGIEYTFKPL